MGKQYRGYIIRSGGLRVDEAGDLFYVDPANQEGRSRRHGFPSVAEAEAAIDAVLGYGKGLAAELRYSNKGTVR